MHQIKLEIVLQYITLTSYLNYITELRTHPDDKLLYHKQ